MQRVPRTVACTLAAVLLLAGQAVAQFVDHPTQAKRVRERYGLDERVPPKGLPARPFLDEHFVRIPTGAFDLYVSPLGLSRDEEIERLIRIADTLLAGVEVWNQWLPAAERGTAKQLEKDVAKARKWLGRWKPRTLRKALDEGLRGDALTMFEARDDVREAFGRLTEHFASGRVVGLEGEGEPIPIVLCPTRTEFLEMLSFAGWAEPSDQDVFWAQGTEVWTHFYMEEVRFYSLQHPGGGSLDSEKVPDGTQQQVLQLATGALLESWYGERMAMTLIAGISLNLVVEVFGQCNTRIDGDLRARKTEAFEVFVPGGLSEGGVLPAISADSRWREFQGAQHFVTHLAGAQKEGAVDMKREGGGKYRHFRLVGDNAGTTMVVSAPFLGLAARDREIPGAVFQGDWLEFVRAYRSCFLYWLRTEAAGSEKASAEAHARLLRELIEARTPEEVDATWARVYEVEGLSSAEVGRDTLEGEFLVWLSRQK